MASMQCYKDESKDFEYYNYENSSSAYQKPTTYSSSGYQQSHYEKERCYETKPGMTGYGGGYGHQNGLNNGCNSSPMGFGMGRNSHEMGFGKDHNFNVYGNNHHMQKPGCNGPSSMGPLGHVLGFGKKHEGHGAGYGMGGAFGCTTTYKKEHRQRKGKGGYHSGSDCSDSSDDDRC